MRIKATILATLLVFPACALAWNGTGHMVVAEIAHDHLTSRTQEICDRLIAVPVEPASAQARTNTFITASNWADDVRGQLKTGEQHYINITYNDQATTSTFKPPAMNVVIALDQYAATLRDPKASDADKAVALRYTIHFMGDIHQPLHAVARITNAHPGGDRGGGLFKIPGDGGKETSLHSLWDGGCGFNAARVQRPLDGAGLKTIEDLAGACEGVKFDAEKTTPEPFMKIADEGYAIAVSSAYAGIEEGAAPGADYLARGSRISRERLALAGLRLANLLNGIFDPK